ncbi:MAG: hypothetical protein ACPGYP_04635 [Solirubrobacterales bacterium]
MPRLNSEDRGELLPYHVYKRANRGRAAFRDDADRDRFRDLVAGRLSRSHSSAGPDGRPVRRVEGVDLFAMCLLRTHFHLVLWQKQEEAMRRLMQSVLTSYVMYFNRRYGTRGPLYSGPFEARALKDPKDLRWAIAYVHCNDGSGPNYRYSTHRAYVDPDQAPGWLNTRTPLKYFGGVDNYLDFLNGHNERAQLNERFFGSRYE